MMKNVTTPDLIARLILAAVLVAAYFGGYVSGTLGVITLVVAAVMAVTAMVSFCPIYMILGKMVGDSAKQDPEKSGVCCGGCGGEGHGDEAQDGPPKLS